MAFRVILFFENRANGWQEVYYTNNSTFANAETLATQLMNARQTLLADPALITAYRISDEANPRASTLTATDRPSTGNYGSRADRVQAAVMARFYGASNTRSRPLYLRGVPDDYFDLQTPNNPDAQSFDNNFSLFKALIEQGGFQIKVRPRPTPLNVNAITTWATTTPSKNSTATLTNPPSTDPPFFIQTYGVKGLPFAPGLVKVVDLTGAVATIVYRTPADYVYPGGGTWLEYTPTYELITNAAVIGKVTSRATGRPFGVSRGRRRSITR